MSHGGKYSLRTSMQKSAGCDVIRDYPFVGGGYFISSDDQAKAIGDLVLARKRAEERLALLEAEGRRIGLYLTTLGGALQGNAANVIFDRQSYDSRFSAGALPSFNPSDFPQVGALLKLTEDTRNTIIEMNAATEGLKKFGL
jgi:hypothetical protein